MLHNRYDYPDYGVSTKLIDINKYSFLTIRPEETYSTDNVKLLPLSRRNCIFSHESAAIKSYGRGDENFVTARYSFQNCMTECRTTVIKSKCGCIPYYYPQNGQFVLNFIIFQKLCSRIKNFTEVTLKL